MDGSPKFYMTTLTQTNITMGHVEWQVQAMTTPVIQFQFAMKVHVQPAVSNICITKEACVLKMNVTARRNQNLQNRPLMKIGIMLTKAVNDHYLMFICIQNLWSQIHEQSHDVWWLQNLFAFTLIEIVLSFIQL